MFSGWIKRKLGLLTPPIIMPYRGYGTKHHVYILGHVLNDRLFYEVKRSDRKLKNLRAMLSRYFSIALPGIEVMIKFEHREIMTTTNKNGLFQAKITFDKTLGKKGWLPVHYVARDPDSREVIASATHEAYIHHDLADYAIISDIDDTILVSHATNFFRKMRLMLTKNALTRLPFAGVAEFYQALIKGTSEHYQNPVFYVSSSEWNLYDYLEDFCTAQDIPKGPFLLQELKSGFHDLFQSGGGTHSHKEDKIQHLFSVYPDVQFILIGDSGQRDAVLYRNIANAYPHRVKAIYIRDVHKKKKRKKVLRIADGFTNTAIDMLLVQDTGEAAYHALQHQWISHSDYEKIIKTIQ